jgi:1-acyl-sn-glycerol-3-phosphate acyltransferase
MTYIKLFLIVLHTIITSFMSVAATLIDRSYYLFFKVTKYYSKGIFLISNIKVKVTGLDNFDHSGTYVFVSNHSSQYDIPAVQSAAPVKVAIIYKKELEKIPIFGWQLWVSPYISINRQKPEDAFRSIEKARELMSKRNVSVLLFAEGTRSRTGEIQPFKRGAFYLASRTGFPIVPVTINGASKILPKGTFKINKGELHVHFDKPIPPKSEINKKEELELMEAVRNKIISNYKGVS